MRELADFRVIVGEEIQTAAGQVLRLFLEEEVRPGDWVINDHVDVHGINYLVQQVAIVQH